PARPLPSGLLAPGEVGLGGLELRSQGFGIERLDVVDVGRPRPAVAPTGLALTLARPRLARGGGHRGGAGPRVVAGGAAPAREPDALQAATEPDGGGLARLLPLRRGGALLGHHHVDHELV